MSADKISNQLLLCVAGIKLAGYAPVIAICRQFVPSDLTEVKTSFLGTSKWGIYLHDCGIE
jgi:hypothetical protein